MKTTALDRIAMGVAAASAGALLIELTWPHELEAPIRIEQPLAAIEPAADEVVVIGPLLDYLSVSERPLFTHDRRPFTILVEEAPVAPSPRVEFELTAVVITSGAQLALLRSSLTPTVQRVGLNQAIDGWTLERVTSESVLLRQGDATVTVPLRPDLGGVRSGHAARIDATATGN